MQPPMQGKLLPAKEGKRRKPIPDSMKAEHIASAARPEQFPPEALPEVAFLGRSNVGKSSLLNCLTGVNGLAYTSARPGCTQMIHFYRMDRRVCLVDLPGYGYARAPLDLKVSWKHLIEQYFEQRTVLELGIILLDARRAWMDKDLELKKWLEFRSLPYVVVATKIDKLTKTEEHRSLGAIRERMDSGEPMPFSAVTGRGAREIWQAIWKTKNLQQSQLR